MVPAESVAPQLQVEVEVVEVEQNPCGSTPPKRTYVTSVVYLVGQVSVTEAYLN